MMSKTDWSDYPYFLAIAQTGTLRAAAELLGTTHATVSRHLDNLEADFNTRLVERSNEGARLTLAGQALLPLIQQAETAIQGAQRKLSGLDKEAAGKIRLSMPPSLAYNVLPPMLTGFMSAYPDIDLDITVTDQFQDISRSESDVSIRVANAVDDNVLGRKLVQYWSGIYASAEYIRDVLPHAGPNGEGLTWFNWGAYQPKPDWVKNSPFPKARVKHHVAAGLMQMHLVLNGAGMSYLPCYGEYFEAGLQMVPGTQPFADRSIWLLLHSDLKDTLRVRLLVEYLADAIKAKRAMFEKPD